MARSIYADKLKNRSNRLRLPDQEAQALQGAGQRPASSCAYRRNAGRAAEGDGRRDVPGTWSVEAGWLKRFALADDFEDANGINP